MAQRVAQEFQDGEVVNLGIGMPVLCVDYLPPGRMVVLHSENGVLGYDGTPEPGQEDPDLINAGRQPILLHPWASIVNHAESFAIIRSGRIDKVVLGGLQVSEKGDLANWTVGQRGLGSPGGAVDLCAGAKQILVMMEHTTKDGQPKILMECTYPLTGKGCVNLMVTDIAVIEVTPQGLLLREVAPGWTPEEVQALTEPT
ncbi:MAG: 3-oxoacid CoA-transferase subunit B, partial [Dehalococcoidia bacterium]